MQDKIIAAIADCLNKQEVARQKWNGNIVKIPVEWPEGIDINDLAAEIAAAIAPLVEAGGVIESDYNTKEFSEWRAKHYELDLENGKWFSKFSGRSSLHSEIERTYEKIHNKSCFK